MSSRTGCPLSSLIAVIFASTLSLSARSDARAQGEPANAIVSMDAESTSVTSVLQILAERSGFNIVTGPSVQGKKISMRLRDTPFEEALNLVVRAAGLGYERSGNSILVTDTETLASATGMSIRVFDLQYANAQDLRGLLEVVTKSVTANSAGNRLVVRGSPATVEQAAAVIAHLDQKPKQVLLDARLIEVDTSALKEIGIDWEKITKWSTVVTEGNHGTSSAGQVPSDLDFLRLNETDDYFRQVATFNVALDALITKGSARLLSNIRIVTMDRAAAEIFAGETIPVVITSLQSPGAGGGVFQTVQLEKIDVGVKLNITPRIAENGFITAVVEPEVSRIQGFVGPGSDLPQTSTRRARTIVRVRDGETIYLGGLLSDEKRRTVKKVPLLGSLPLLGHLFRHYRDDSVRLDLVIEITPRIVGDEGMSLPSFPTEDLRGRR